MFLADKTQGQTWSAAYRSDPCQIFRDSTTPAPLHSPAQSHLIQRAVLPPLRDPFVPANSLYEAEADSGRPGTVTSVTGSGCPPEFGLGFETDHGFIGSHLSAPVYTPQTTHDNYAFQNATLTATTEGTASRQDSFAQVQPPANDSIAISPRIPGLDAFTTKWESTVLPVTHDPSLSPTGHRSHIPLPHKVTIADDFFQPAMSSSVSGEHIVDDPQSVSIQFHESVSNTAHYLRHVNSRHWQCIWRAFSSFRLGVISNVIPQCLATSGKHFSNRYNGRRHVRESVLCSTW